MARKPVVVQSPWQTWSIKSAFELIESGAAARGFVGVRLAPDSISFDAPLVGKRPLPPELYTFLSWCDRKQWHAFIAPASAVTGHERAASIVLRSSAQLVTATTSEHAHASPVIASFVASLPQLGRDPDWINTQLIAFAETHDGRTIYLATDPPGISRGSVVSFDPSTNDVVVLAGGLAQWLTRLAACSGAEVVLLPDLMPLVPESARAFIRSEFGL
ncbi:MAG TPA: hypothetical protein VK157_17465 [Phycisphaerales bacterium]|nr:hypothetical protein [Phycisphaerales bacterium]